MDADGALDLDTAESPPPPAFPGTAILPDLRTMRSEKVKNFRLSLADHLFLLESDSDTSYISGTLLYLPSHLRRRGRPGCFLEDPPCPEQIEIGPIVLNVQGEVTSVNAMGCPKMARIMLGIRASRDRNGLKYKFLEAPAPPNVKSESQNRRRRRQPKKVVNKTSPLKRKKFTKKVVVRKGCNTPTRTNALEKDISDSEDVDVDVVTVESENETQTANLSEGVRIQSQNIICVVCGKICRNGQALRNHSISHSDVKAYECNFCGTKFKFKHNLNRHVRLYHSGKKSFSCQICEVSFERYVEMRKHRRIYSENRSFKCCVLNCNEFYSSMSALQKHKLRDHNDLTKPVLNPVLSRKLKLVKKRSRSSHGQVGGRLSIKSPKEMKVKPKSPVIKAVSKCQTLDDVSLPSNNQSQSLSIVPEKEESTPQQQQTPDGKIRDRFSGKSSNETKAKPKRRRRINKVPSKPRESKDCLSSSVNEGEGEAVSYVPENDETSLEYTPRNQVGGRLSSKILKTVKAKPNAQIIKVPAKRRRPEDCLWLTESEIEDLMNRSSPEPEES